MPLRYNKGDNMKKVNLKSSPKRKLNFKIFKFLFLILIVICSYFFTINYYAGKNMDLTDEEYVKLLLNQTYKTGKSNYTFIVNESLKLISRFDLTKPETMLDSKIVNSVNSETNLVSAIKDETGGEDDYSVDTYEKLTSYISNPNNKEVQNPEVYIYNTHQLETYSNGGLENYNITPNIMMMSYLLSEKLNKSGIPTIAEDTNMAEFMRISNIKSSELYATSRILIDNARSKYPSLKYFIDVHRDSVSKDITTCEINGKKYARILFVVGSSNPNYAENEKVARAIDDISDELYPCMSRGIYKRGVEGWVRAYNQDISKDAMLIEVGGKENEMQEVLNTIDALSNVLKKYIKEE